MADSHSQQTCLMSAVAAAGITAGNLDLSSSCSNKTATAKIEACSLEACTIREQLSTNKTSRHIETIPC